MSMEVERVTHTWLDRSSPLPTSRRYERKSGTPNPFRSRGHISAPASGPGPSSRSRTHSDTRCKFAVPSRHARPRPFGSFHREPDVRDLSIFELGNRDTLVSGNIRVDP